MEHGEGPGQSTEHPDMWERMQVRLIEARRQPKHWRPFRDQANGKACGHVVRTTEVLNNNANTSRREKASGGGEGQSDNGMIEG